MLRIHQASLFLLASLSAITLAHAQAQQPPDVVQSDEKGNTAMGTSALLHNIPGLNGEGGFSNTAAGESALTSNEHGFENTAVGAGALVTNINGHDNTAVGYLSLAIPNNTNLNTAVGSLSLYGNQEGSFNTAIGANTLVRNISGNYNTASGTYALQFNSTGNGNTGTGINSLYANVSGNNNSAFGHSALRNAAGDNNIGVGFNAGLNVTGGSNNVEIANTGAAGDNGVIRIGTPTVQTKTLVAGIADSKVTGSAVYVTPTGQLGTLASSERYKTRIATLSEQSERLRKLRPVSFHLKAEPRGAVQYGLIAEEVAHVYPELVIRDGSGQIAGVRYEELAPLLLNEVQQQQQALDAQARQINDMQRQLAELSKRY